MSYKLIKLEALRGFAAFYVVAHHLFASGLELFGIDFSFLFRFGQEAVILFFVLSGFVIYFSFTKSKNKDFLTYFTKRFLRIFFPLIIIFIVNYSLVLFYKNVIEYGDSRTLICNLLMLQDSLGKKPNVISETFLNNQPLWSLSYEWWFYMIFFLLISKLKNKISFFIYGIGILSAVSNLFYPFFINRIFMYLVIWWSGAEIAKLYLQSSDINFINLKKPLIAIFSVAFVLGINVLIKNQFPLKSLSSLGENPWLEFRHFLFAFLALVSALIWKKFSWFGFNSTIGLFSGLASISFGVYISHWFLVINAHYLDAVFQNIVVRKAMYFLICLLFSYWVERILYPKVNKFVLQKVIK